MFGRDEIDVVTTFFLKHEHQPRNFLRAAFISLPLLRNVPVLTKYAAQIAIPEEYSARSVPPSKAVFLAEMRKRAGHDGVTSGVTHLRFILKPIDMTISRAGATVFEFSDCAFHPRGKSPAPMKPQVGRFEIGNQVARVGRRRMGCRKHKSVTGLQFSYVKD